jgi:hypothetical protein
MCVCGSSSVSCFKLDLQNFAISSSSFLPTYFIVDEMAKLEKKY